eukprot:s1952_g19.t1
MDSEAFAESPDRIDDVEEVHLQETCDIDFLAFAESTDRIDEDEAPDRLRIGSGSFAEMAKADQTMISRVAHEFVEVPAGQLFMSFHARTL